MSAEIKVLRTKRGVPGHALSFTLMALCKQQLLLLLMTASAFGQDLHFSQFSTAPLSLNPALTGDFNGEFRVGYLYRNQWNSVASPFLSSSLFGDKKILQDKLNGDYMGGGIAMLSDNTGAGALTMMHFSVNAAYHHFLNKAQTQKISGGIQIAAFQKSINPNLLVFENQFNYADANFSGPTNGENLNASTIVRPDVQLGATYWYSTQKYYITSGLSVAHLNMPNQSFTGARELLAPKFIAHAEGQYFISKKLSLAPSIMILYQNKAAQMNIGAMINRGFGKTFKENIYLKAGIWYRLGDAVNFLVGMNHNNWQLNFSYDLNASRLYVASNYTGALELSIVYTHNLFNTQKSKINIVPCNRHF